MANPLQPRSDQSPPVIGDSEVLTFLTGSIDRSIPTQVGAQLRGGIEFGIVSQALPPGARLPSIRTLAHATGLAAETVASAYRALQSNGLLTSFQGSGTFISDLGTIDQLGTIERQLLNETVDAVLEQAQRAGVPIADLITMVRLRHGHHPPSDSPLRLAMIGIFEDATQAYARDIQNYLKPGDTIDALTVEQLSKATDRPEPDLYITLPSREQDVLGLVGFKIPLTTIGLIPSEKTRSFLASLAPNTALALVARFPSFIKPMRQSTQAFAPHMRNFVSMALDDPKLAETIGKADVVVYSTGADEVRNLLLKRTPTAEFRHTPDPHALQDILLPLLESLRRRK